MLAKAASEARQRAIASEGEGAAKNSQSVSKEAKELFARLLAEEFKLQ